MWSTKEHNGSIKNRAKEEVNYKAAKQLVTQILDQGKNEQHRRKIGKTKAKAIPPNPRHRANGP